MVMIMKDNFWKKDDVSSIIWQIGILVIAALIIYGAFETLKPF